MIKRFTIAFMLISVVVLFSSGLAQNPDKIVFLDLKMVKGQIHLKNVSIVPGKLKQPRRIQFRTDDLYFTVHMTTGEKLFENTFANPTIILHEYEDENGQFSAKRVVLDSVNFSVRIPYHALIHKVNFYKAPVIIDKEKKLSKQAIEIDSFLVDIDNPGAQE